MIAPPAKSSTFAFGDNPSVAVISLWTPTDFIAKKLDKKHYGIIGNLYSGERGIDTLVRSLLASPEITHLVITGVDTANSGKVLADFFEKGFTEGKTKDTNSPVWKINSAYEGYIDVDIPKEALDELRQSIQVIHWDFNTPYDASRLKPVQRTHEKKVFEKKSAFEKKYFGEQSTYVFRSSKFIEAYLRSLISITRFGLVQDGARKLFNSVFVLSTETKNDPAYTDALGFSSEDVL
ncbi:MAG: hypothetical protein Q7R47_04855, partial [Candidatus Diapherotrites archaeon]|nr:hypothetical protein [Candidatus Diapherotrites archaeon]